MTHKLESIIDSIELSIEELNRNPMCIYIGIGTYAGLIKTDETGQKMLDDENYHQFPPALQKLYVSNPDLHFACIYIDPALEKPVFITQDLNLRQKLFNDHEWNNDDNEFCYNNSRIKVYPFRYSIKIKNTKYNPVNDYIDITTQIERIHKLCIDNDLLYIFHDFSGNNYFKYIEQYFISIQNHLDHIIYGFGNGYISGCYYDLRKPEAQLAFIRNKTNKRYIITTFNISNIINIYNSLDNSEQNRISFSNFLNDTIQQYPIEHIDIIISQIKIYLDEFISDFRNNIFSILRYFYDLSINFHNNITVDFDINSYYFNIFDYETKMKINEIVMDKDVNIFKKIKDIIANKYKIQLEIITSKRNISSIEVLDIITSEPNKYEWSNKFNKMIV